MRDGETAADDDLAATVKALKAGKDTILRDSEFKGFGVRVRKSGRKNYVLQTRVDGKLRWFTIGQHGRVTVDEARAAALEILAATKKGIDPRDANAKRETEPVMAELSRRFLEEYVPVRATREPAPVAREHRTPRP